MVDSGALVRALTEAGWTEYAGVPCSILEPIRREAEEGASTRYLAATVEGEAVAIAAGLWLGGKGCVVLMQNSGLGNAVNPLASLLLPYRIPAVLVISWRGRPGTAEPAHHLPMGAATERLLELLGIPFRVLEADTDVEGVVAASLGAVEAGRGPVAVVVPRDAVAGTARICRGEESPGRSAARGAGEEIRYFGSGAPADRSHLVEAVLERFPHDPVVSTTGYMSRALAARGPRDHHFYMQGSMGFAAAIALGVARARPGRRIVVLDGDGALLMRLGTLSTVGEAAPAGFLHVVADNGCYASTGGQRSAAATTCFPRVARACGYPRAATCSGADGLEAALEWAGRPGGPTLLHVLISPSEAAPRKRPARRPDEIAAAFRRHGTGGIS